MTNTRLDTSTPLGSVIHIFLEAYVQTAPDDEGRTISSSPARLRLRMPRQIKTMARKGVSYVTAAQLVSMARDPRVAIIDVRYARARRSAPHLRDRAGERER